jgi:hypothetical protein
VVAAAEAALRKGDALLGGLPIQPRCLRLVLLHALAKRVADAEVVLRNSKALLRRLCEQPRRLRLVLLHALAHGVAGAESVLRNGVALPCSRLEPQDPPPLASARVAIPIKITSVRLAANNRNPAGEGDSGH